MSTKSPAGCSVRYYKSVIQNAISVIKREAYSLLAGTPFASGKGKYRLLGRSFCQELNGLQAQVVGAKREKCG